MRWSPLARHTSGCYGAQGGRLLTRDDHEHLTRKEGVAFRTPLARVNQTVSSGR